MLLEHQAVAPQRRLCEVGILAVSEVFAVDVPESRDRPHFTGPAFVRDGSQTREANKDQFEKLIEDRSDLVWTLRPYVGRSVAVTREAVHDLRGPIWLETRTDYSLIEVNQHFVVVRSSAAAEVAFSLQRVYLECFYALGGERPELRVRLG